MAINTSSAKDFGVPAVNKTATNVETTHLVFNFTEGAGYLRQVFTDANGQLGLRFLKVTGVKYSNVESGLLTKVQKIADDIESDNSVIDGVEIEEIDREGFFTGTSRG